MIPSDGVPFQVFASFVSVSKPLLLLGNTQEPRSERTVLTFICKTAAGLLSQPAAGALGNVRRPTAMELCIGSHVGDHIIICVGQADFTDGCDWVPCSLDIAAGAWRGSLDVSLCASDFPQFRTQLQTFYNTLAGTARFDTTERQLELEFSIDNLGHVAVKGIAVDRVCDGNRLSFVLTLDQSYLPDIIAQLHAIESTFKPE